MKKIDTFQTFARGVKGLVAVMLLMLMAVGGAFAQTTYDFSTYPEGEQYAVNEEHVLDGSVTIYTTECHFTEQLRVYASDQHSGFFYSNALPNVIDSLSFNIGHKADNLLVYGSTNGIDWTLVGSIATTSAYADKGISFRANEYNYFKCKVGGSNQLRIKSMTIFYQSSPAAVAAPTCTPAAGMFYAAQEVTLATTTVGATIYYSLDGSTPSLLYNDPIEISEATTLKAFAVLGEDTSAVTSAEYTFPVDAATIAELKANGVQNTIYKVAEDVVVIFQNGQYLFVQDEDAAVVVYGNVVKTYNAGDVISGGFFGKYTVYNNMNELTTVNDAPAFPAGVAGTPVEPTVATVSEVANNYLTWESKLVKFENVTFVDADHFTQGDDTMKVYNMFGTSCSLAAGYTANVTGLIGKFHDDVQILPRTNADVEVVSAPAAELPYRVDFDDNIDENLAINNGNYTNKWYIGKAQDFDNNKLYISSSIGRTNKYNNEAASEVTVSRNLVIPAKGAIVTFDCRYKGETNDYLQFSVSNDDLTFTQKVNSTNNEWENVTLSIPSEMAGIVTISFTWKNNDNGGGEQYPAAIDNIYIYESSCSQPAALSPTVDTTSATITWSGDAEAYLLQYKLANHSEWYSVNTNDTTVTLTNLQGNSNYDVRVQSVCEEYASAWTEGHFAVDCQNYITVPEEKIVGTETSSTYNAPFNNFYKNSWNECIYPASEFNGPATINSISWNCASSADLTFSSLKIYMGTRTSETYSSNSDWTPESALQLVYDGTDVRVGASRGWQEFILNTPFEYNGTDNLVVVVAKKQSSYSSNLKYYYTNVSNTCLYRQSDDYEYYADYPGTNTGTLYYSRANIKFNMIVSSCGDPILCPDVTGVVVSDITKEGATITWTPGSEDQDNFIVEYKAANEVEWTVADSNISTPTYNLTGLDPFTNYIVRVKANCGTYNVSESQLSEQFRTKGICTPVTEISHYNLATTAVLTWTPGADETAWTVKFKPTAADESAWVMIPVQGQATASLGGLQASTPYDVQILALCEGDPMGLSDWATYSFTSACATVDIPVAYTLKSDDHDCWVADNAFSYLNGALTNTPGASLISPAFNIPREGQYFVSFDVEGDYQLLASYRGTRDDRFEILTSGSDAEGKVIVAIPEEYLGRGVNFKFICTSEHVPGLLQVSNFKINACPFEPTNLTVSNTTETSATLSWTADELATNFQVQYGERGFVLGEGTTIDVVGNSTTIDGFEYGKQYDFYVKANCVSGASEVWVGPKTATIEIVYIIGQEETISACIGTLYDNGGPYANYADNSNDQVVIYPSTEGQLINLTGSYSTEKGYDFITIYDGESTAAEQLIQVSGDGTIDVMSTTGPLTVQFSSDYSTNKSGFAFAIQCTPVPSCGRPSIAVNGVNATITRSIFGTPTSYELQIGDEIRSVTGTTCVLTDLFNLESLTEYQVSVRSICGDADTSVWSNSVAFETPCIPVSVPFFESFENTPFVNSCWTNEHISGPGSLLWTRSTDSKHSGNASARIPDMRATTLTNLVTPAISIEEANKYRVSLWVYRNTTGTDKPNEGVKVYANTQPNTEGAVELFHAHRYTGFAPVQTTTGWYQYEAPIPLSGNIYVIVEGICEYGSATYIDDILVEKIPTCYPPVSITASDLKTTKATLTWVNDDVNNPSVPSTWEIKYGLAGFDVETEGESVIVNDTLSYQLTNLDMDALYEVYIRALCAEDDQSIWSDKCSFTTLCPFKPLAAIGDGTATNYGVPVMSSWGNSYCQSIFTADELLAAGLSAGSITGITYTWTKNSNYAKEFTIFLGQTMQSNYSSASDNISLNNQTQVYTGSHIKNTEGAVTYSFTTPFEWDGVSNIVVSTFMNQPSGVSQSSSEFFGNSTVAGSIRTVYGYKDSNPYTVDNASASATSDYRPTVVFAGECDVTMTCIRPNVVTVGTVTENTAVISWTNANEEMPDHFVVKYGEKGFDVETEGTAVSVSGLSTTLTDLTNNQKYDVYVQAVCVVGADTSLWTDVVTFKTECGILELPYTEDFEDYTPASSCSSTTGIVMPDCWTSDWTAQPSSSNYCPKVTNYSSYKPGDGNYLYFMAGGSYYSYYQNPTVVILPEFNADLTQAMISFRARCSNSSSYTYGALYLGYVNAANEFTSLSTIECATSANAPLQTIALAQYTIPEGSKLAFKADYTYSSSYSSFQVGIDDILVEEAPTCITPTDLTVVSAADTTAQLAWTDQLHQPAYKVQYRLVGESTWQEVTGITATNCTLRGLQPSSDYEACVLADCGEGDESEATEIVNFSTMCLGGVNQEIAIGEGTGTNAYVPTNTFYNYSLTQQIFTPQEINYVGNLNSVSFYSTASDRTRKLSVYLVHTNKSAFTGNYDWITVSNNDKVFEGNVNFVANDWTTIEFTTPFAYNGTDNLALIVDDNTGNYVSGPSFSTYLAADSRAIYVHSDGTNYNPQSPTSYYGTLLSSSNQVYFNKGIIYCPPTCPDPTALQVDNVTANAATITWTAGGSETAWNVEYGKAGFTPGEGTMLAVEEASVELTGLEMGVAYDVYVQANCAEDDQSEWVPAKFVTECEAIATLPYTQDFEGETFEPACWSQEQLAGDDPWELVSDGRNQFTMFTFTPNNSADLITPAFNLSSYESVMMTFDHVQWPYADIVDKLELLYRTSEGDDWTLLQEYADETGEYVVPLVWKNERIILPEEALADNVQFAFRGIGLDGNNIYLDNVVVMETPDCYEPTDLTLNGVTTTTANISWTAGDDVQTAWNVQYGEHNFTLGEGTIVAVDTTMAELTNLTGGTAYDVYVQSVCNESDSSAWAGPIVIATECVTINTLPYTQDFDSDFFEPLCWSQEQLSGSYPWKWYSDNTGNLFAGFPYNRNNSADLITPKFNLTSYESVMLSFEHVQMPDAGVVDKLELFYRTSEDADWTLIKEYTEATSDYVDYLVWKNETMILPEEALTDNVQFAFRGTGIYGNNIYLDNVVLMETPCGHIEDLAVAQDSMTDTRAYITWTGIAEEYSLEYQEVNDETWTVVPVTGKAQWLTDLTPSTNYNVRVKAVCAEETQYSEVIDFSTYCLGYYFDKYGAVQCPELHNDLTVNNLSVFRTACEINDPVVVKVTNNAYLDTITSLNLYYVVNDGDTVAETLTMATPLCYQNESTYTFNEIPVFEEGNNMVYAWVEYNDSTFRANVVSAHIIEPNDEYPYYKNLDEAAPADGWNAYDVNEDGVTMIIPSLQGVSYTYNDTLDANDWMITPCFYFEPGKYVISYSYNANSVLKESFEFWYGNGAKVADMTTMLGSEEFSGTAVNTASYDFDVTEAGVYNFGFWATSLAGNLGFNITNFSIEPVNIVTITTDGNGTTTPSGEVYVNYNKNLTLNIVPNVNYHLSAIYVDSVQVVGEDPYASRFVMYTLENVTEPHDVFVEFKLEFHTHKIVSNYNPAYDQTEGGYFVPATSDTTIRVSDHTVYFASNEHYHFNSLTLSEMDETDPVDFTDSVVYDETTGLYAFTFYNLTVPDYFVNAQFRRDTVNIHYTALTGQGYADASPRMIAGDSVFGEYDTWVDYDLHGDLDTTITITPAGDYHLVNVYVNGQPQNVESDEFHYTFSNVTETQYVDVNFGYQVTTSIRNYVPTYLGSDDVRGTIAPDTQLVAEGYPTVVTGTVQEHFHLYNLFVDGVDMIDQVVFDGNNYSLTIDSTIANYHIEAVVKIDTFGIHYNVMSGQGYADESDMLVAPAEYTTWINYGDDFMMNLAPGRGFSIGNVFVDGIDMYTANNYLFEYVIDEHYVDVTFVPNDYTITTNAYGHGTVTDGMSFTYDPANPVNYQFTATAEEGYHISAIVINDAEIDLTGVTDTYTQTLENVAANYVINAIFEINTYNMFSEASLGGTITPEGLQVVNHGTDLTYEIVADEGRYISSITIDGETTEYTQADNVTNYIQLFTSINADHSVSATFAVKHFTITAEVNAEANHGTIDGESSFSGEFSYGSNQTLNFIPEENYQVSDVVVDGQSVGAVASYEFVNITAEHNVVVSFAPVQYTLTATSNVPACTITPATTTVQAGSNVNYTLTVATGYHLLNVIANGEEVSVSGNAFTIANVQEDYEIFANFAPNYVTVTVEQPAHATITPGTMTYAYGATPSYVIVPEVGYNVTAVHAGNALVNVTYNNGIGSFTLNPVTADLTVTATTAIKTFTITATQSAHGTISPAAVQTVNYGGNVTYTITPDDYYEIVDVLVDGTSRGALSTYTFNNVTANHTIEAVFEAACMTPSRLTVVYVDTNSATLTWEGNANSYEVRYRAAGETNFTTQTVTTNTITLTGLTENTLYAWGVKANCTASMSSDWAESAFRTNAVIPPYVGISTADLSSIKVYSHLNNVYIVNENGIAIENVTIYNIFGAQVYTGKANNNPEIISLDVANGNYIVRLSTENGVGVYKLSIVR